MLKCTACGNYNQDMWKKYLFALLLIGIVGCGTLPLFQRSAPSDPGFNGMLYSEEIELGRQVFEELLRKETLSYDGRLVTLVERVGHRLAAVTSAPKLEWEFKLIESDNLNAFALPGGKVAVSTGLLPLCANEAGLAAVLGHVIAHAVVRHGAQRLPPQILLTGGSDPVPLADHADREIILEALGVGTEPFSHENELEADQIGLIYMARAGYDPREAEHFWKRFQAMKNGTQLPQILAAHPIGPTRIQDLQRLLPGTTPVYRRSANQYGLGESFLYILNRRKLEQRRQPAPPLKIPQPAPAQKPKPT